MTNSEIKLLPCPFCGSRNVGLMDCEIGRRRPKDIKHYVWCNNCGAEGPAEFEHVAWANSPGGEQVQAKAVSNWNTRGEIYRIALEAAHEVATKIMASTAHATGMVAESMPVDMGEEYGFVAKDEET